VSDSAQAPAVSEPTLIFRPNAAQRWAPLIATAVVIIVAVTLALVAVARHNGAGNFTVYSIVAGCVALILLYTTVTGRKSVTECRPEGIRTQRFRAHECSWSEISDIRQQSVAGKATTAYLVVVTTRAGKRFKLGVPTSSSSSRNPLFDDQLGQIIAYWHAAADDPAQS
jgi:hypothetical protein